MKHTPGHRWTAKPDLPYEICEACGMVKRRDGKNKPCKGPSGLRPFDVPRERRCRMPIYVCTNPICEWIGTTPTQAACCPGEAEPPRLCPECGAHTDVMSQSLRDELQAQINVMAQYQRDFWDAAGELEKRLDIEIDTTADLEGITLDDLFLNAEGGEEENPNG